MCYYTKGGVGILDADYEGGTRVNDADDGETPARAAYNHLVLTPSMGRMGLSESSEGGFMTENGHASPCPSPMGGGGIKVFQAQERASAATREAGIEGEVIGEGAKEKAEEVTFDGDSDVEAEFKESLKR
jgi:hypothetical protein